MALTQCATPDACDALSITTERCWRIAAHGALNRRNCACEESALASTPCRGAQRRVLAIAIRGSAGKLRTRAGRKTRLCRCALQSRQCFAGAGTIRRRARSYAAALALEPQRPDALNNLGLALIGSRRPAEALETTTACSAIDPDHLGALHNRANALTALGRSRTRLPLRQGLAKDPANTRRPQHSRRRPRQAPPSWRGLGSYDAALAAAPDRVDIQSIAVLLFWSSIVSTKPSRASTWRLRAILTISRLGQSRQRVHQGEALRRGSGELRQRARDQPEQAVVLTDRGVRSPNGPIR